MGLKKSPLVRAGGRRPPLLMTAPLLQASSMSLSNFSMPRGVFNGPIVIPSCESWLTRIFDTASKHVLELLEDATLHVDAIGL